MPSSGRCLQSAESNKADLTGSNETYTLALSAGGRLLEPENLQGHLQIHQDARDWRNCDSVLVGRELPAFLIRSVAAECPDPIRGPARGQRADPGL